MACSGTFSGMAQLILGTKTVRRAAALGVVIQSVTMLLGIGIVLMEEILNVGMSPVWMMALQVITAVITLFAVNFRRIS